MSNSHEARLAALGIELPNPASPAANYVPYTISGKTLFVAGQITIWNGELRYLGRLGADLDVAKGAEAARLCGLNLIAQARQAAGGSLDGIKRVLKLGGFVNCTADFIQHPQVINGASDLMVDVFGEAGKHARFAVGAVSLPRGVAVEVDAIFELA
ncbi:RidA family protein [Ferrovibrio sp.]|uniref:RidA family protein n=1 Tax=Ferrovibrio sp. TaxID=1917215 RepID=UPI001B5EE90D|nr:RidA family protein [Ferrovibrio sp.]MBP7066225.1 RidA family protein [Ferrovibrio sp.]